MTPQLGAGYQRRHRYDGWDRRRENSGRELGAQLRVLENDLHDPRFGPACTAARVVARRGPDCSGCRHVVPTVAVAGLGMRVSVARVSSRFVGM